MKKEDGNSDELWIEEKVEWYLNKFNEIMPLCVALLTAEAKGDWNGMCDAEKKLAFLQREILEA